MINYQTPLCRNVSYRSAANNWFRVVVTERERIAIHSLPPCHSSLTPMHLWVPAGKGQWMRWIDALEEDMEVIVVTDQHKSTTYCFGLMYQKPKQKVVSCRQQESGESVLTIFSLSCFCFFLSDGNIPAQKFWCIQPYWLSCLALLPRKYLWNQPHFYVNIHLLIFFQKIISSLSLFSHYGTKVWCLPTILQASEKD